MADWYYGKDNAQHGPVSDLEIRNLISTGQITQDTMIWHEGMTDWLPLKQVEDLNTPAGTSQQNQEGPTPYASPQSNAALPPHGMSIPTDGLAIASLVCGILAVISCYVWALFGIPAVICGHMSLKKINTSPTPIAGKGMAIAGLVTGYIGIALQLCIIVVFLVAFIGAAASS